MTQQNTVVKTSPKGLKKYNHDEPQQLVTMANVLKDYIVNHKLYTNIKGKNYAHVEGWQFAGKLLGFLPLITEVKDLSTDKEVKWMVTVDIVNKDGGVVSRGFALCSNKEAIKKSFDEYAILSMAQTRAIGKAYRNLLGWVLKLAGYEGTPSEEMRKVDQQANGEVPTIQTEADIAKDLDKSAKCVKCGDPVSKAAETYSKRVYKKVLCREHQPKKK